MNRISTHKVLLASVFALVVGGLMFAADSAWAETSAVSTFTPAEPVNMTRSCLTMIGGLFLCLGVFAAGVHVYRRYAAAHGLAGRRRLVVRERLPLSGKAALMLVAFDGREFLVASGSERVSLISSPPTSGLEFGDSLSELCDDSEVFDG